MANRDPRAILPEQNRQFRKLDVSQSISNLQSNATKASKEFAPILQAIVALLKQYQEDTNIEQDERVLKLANLILDRHTALLDSLTTSADKWKTVKDYIEIKINDLLGNYQVDNQNSSKPDPNTIIDEVNSAITAALIKYNQSNQKKQTKTTDKPAKNTKQTQQKLTDDVIKKRASTLIQSKEYKGFLNELKNDFEDFLKKYDDGKKEIVQKLKPATQKPTSKTNILGKLTNIFKDKPITKKDRQPKKSRNPFKSLDLKPFRIATVGVVGAAFIKGFKIAKKSIAGLVGFSFRLVKNVVLSGVKILAGMIKGFLALAKGPFNAIISILFVPIKFIYKAIMFVVKPLYKIVSGLVKIILAPIKFLIKGPLKLIKGVFSVVTGLFSGIFSFIKSRTIAKLLKLFLYAGGAFMLGYIVGIIWKKFIKPRFMNIRQIVASVVLKYLNLKRTVKNYIDVIKKFFEQVFNKDKQPNDPTSLAYKVRKIIDNVVSAWKWIYKKFVGSNLAEGVFNALDFFKGALGTVASLLDFIKSGTFETIMKTAEFIRKALTSPVGKAARQLQGIAKIIGIAISFAVQGIKSLFRLFSGKKNKIELKDEYVQTLGGKIDASKTSYLNPEKKKQYDGILAGLSKENDMISNAQANSEELFAVAEKFGEKLTDYPGFMTEVTTSFALGVDSPEVLELPSNFDQMDLDDQQNAVNDLLSERVRRAAEIKSTIKTNNKDAVLALLDKIKNQPSKMKLSTYKNTMTEVANTMISGNKAVVIGGKTLKANKEMKITVDQFRKDAQLREDLIAAGIEYSGDWGRGSSTVTINADPVAIAKLAELREQRRINALKESALNNVMIGYAKTKGANYDGKDSVQEKVTETAKIVNYAQKVKFQVLLKDYFSKVDMNKFNTDEEAIAAAEKYALDVLEGKKVEINAAPSPAKELTEEQKKMAENIETLQQVDNGNNNVVINNTKKDENPALVEAKRQ